MVLAGAMSPRVLPDAVNRRDDALLVATEAPPASTDLSDPGLDDRSLYSDTDIGVQPPRIRYPRLPTLPSGDADVNTMELVISKQGSVERVRLISQPNQVLDMMLLHAAKSWVFDPASKQGHPVRYRLVVNWAPVP
jgi:hypothetical protein